MAKSPHITEWRAMVAQEYIDGHGSSYDISAKYSISTDYVLWGWIKRYNANRELKDYCPKKEVYMADARRKGYVDGTVKKSESWSINWMCKLENIELADKRIEKYKEKWCA